MHHGWYSTIDCGKILRSINIDCNLEVCPTRSCQDVDCSGQKKYSIFFRGSMYMSSNRLITRALSSLLRVPCSLIAQSQQGPLRSLTNHSSISQSSSNKNFLSAKFSIKNARMSSLSCDALRNASCQEVSELINQEYKYLDVRTPEEYANGHVSGSINIPVWVRDQSGQMTPNAGFLEAVQTAFPDKGAKICVACLSGKRSEAASAILSDAGYDDLVNMPEGYQGWCGAGLPVVSPK
jgi:rhodanese-related sulfurtransferase